MFPSADEAERQLVEFIEGFAPDAEVQEEILRRLAEEVAPESHDTAKRREALEERLRRMRDLYELGDLERAEYVARRNAINAELEAMAPRPLPNLDRAQEVLKDFSIFWREESEHEAKRQFLRLIFDGIWLDDRRVVAVQPTPAFFPYFNARAKSLALSPARRACPAGPGWVQSGSDGTRTRDLCRDRAAL